VNPNQQPQSSPQPQQPAHPAAQPVFAQPPATYQSPQPTVQPAAAPEGPLAPAPPSAYADAPPVAYDPNYLDSIAPAPPRAKFFSGSFGKIFYAMIGVFVLAVSLIIAFSGKDKTADLQQTQVRVTNFALLAKTEQKDLKSNKLSSTNSSFHLLLENAETDGEKLLGQAGVKKSQYDKKMVATEKSLTTDLTTKFTNARLNAALDRTYANTMAAETSKLITMFQAMSKKSGAKAIRDYAAKLASNLDSIQKSFDTYVDDGN
jgi:hypothetical protein